MSLRIGVAGCGSFASVMATASRFVGGVSLAACFDPDAERMTRFSQRQSIALTCDSFEELLSAPIDALYLPAPHFLHVPYARAALEAGKHVFSEKPLAFTGGEARELVSLAERADRVLAVNFHNRYDRRCRRFVDGIRAGAVGKPIFAHVVVPWSRPLEYALPGSWHAQIQAAGGGTLITQAIHALDIVLASLGEEPVSYCASAGNHKFTDNETEDTLVGQMAFESGAVLQIASTMAASDSRPAHVSVVGTTGRREVALADGVRFMAASVKSLRGFRDAATGKGEPLHAADKCVATTAVVEQLYRAAGRAPGSAPSTIS